MPETLGGLATRMGTTRAGMEAPNDPPPRVCAPTAEPARSATIVAPVKWTFQFIFLPYLTRCPRLHGGCSFLRIRGSKHDPTGERAPASDFPCFPGIAGYVITVRLWKAMQTCTLLRIVRIPPNKNRARSIPAASVQCVPRGWNQSVASSFAQCAAITCLARTIIEATRRKW
jgi:hypothetical protein